MRILIYTATYGDGPQPETIESVQAQRCDGRFEHEIGWHNPYGEGDLANVTAQMERARLMTLDGSYDALLSVEHDMLIPPDALQLLWDTWAPVAYGVYLFRHGIPVLNAYELYPQPSVNVGESLSLKPRRLAEAIHRVTPDVSGIGFGCTLIRRQVLLQTAFRHRDNERNGTDTMFAQDCVRAGIRQVAHFGVQCGHWNGRDWLWPFSPTREHTLWVRALQTVNVAVCGQSVHLEKGRDYELPEDEVGEIRRGGYVALIGDGVRHKGATA